MSIKVTNSSEFPHVVYDLQVFLFCFVLFTRLAVEQALNARNIYIFKTSYAYKHLYKLKWVCNIIKHDYSYFQTPGRYEYTPRKQKQLNEIEKSTRDMKINSVKRIAEEKPNLNSAINSKWKKSKFKTSLESLTGKMGHMESKMSW